MKNRVDIVLLVLLAVALVVKVGYLFFALANPTSVGHLSVDALYHYKWASMIAAGDLLTNAPYFRAPLYPFILAMLLKISGDSLIFVRLIQLLAGCLSLFFAYRIASVMFGKRTGILTVLLLILYPFTTYFEGELLLDSVFTLFALGSLYYFVCKKNGRERPIGAGLFFALAALTRPTILIFLPVICIYYLWRWKVPAERKNGFRNAFLFLCISVILIAPVTIINFLSSDQFILISYQGGVNFHIGNNPEADGLSSALPGAGKDWNLEDADNLAYKESGRKLVYGDQSLFWYKKGLSHIIDNPGQVLELFIRKVYFLFSGHEVSNNRPLDEVVFQNPLLSSLPVRFSLLISLAVLPLFLAHDNRRRYFRLWGLISLYGFTVAIFFVSSRFRLPIVPLIAMTAGWGLVCLWKTIRERRIDHRLFFGIVCSVGIFIVASSTVFPISLVNPEQSLFFRGNQSLRQGDYRTALARFDSLTQIQPDYENGHLNLGIAYLKLGMIEKAAAGFGKEIQYYSASAEAANNLGVTFLLRNQNDSARNYCQKALEFKPYYTEAAINYLRSARGETRPRINEIVEGFRHLIREANEDQPAYIFEEALYFSDRKRIHEAIDNHLRIMNILSHRQPSVDFDFSYSEENDRDNRYKKLASYQLGYLYGLSGEFETSVRFSKQAIEIDPDLKEAYINLVSGYRSLGQARLADSVAAVYQSKWPGQ